MTVGEADGLGSNFFACALTSTLRDQKAPCKLRILVLERHDALREMLVDQLRVSGLGVIESFVELQDLEQRLSAQGADALVLSMEDPCYDGMAVCARLREAYPAIIQIAMSAYGGDDQRVKALNAGANYLCAKPVSSAELVASIRRICGTNLAAGRAATSA